MNRRSFIAGLLASSAAVPLAKAELLYGGPPLGRMVETDGFDIFVSTPISGVWSACLRATEAAYMEAVALTVRDLSNVRIAINLLDAASVPTEGRFFADGFTADERADMLALQIEAPR